VKNVKQTKRMTAVFLSISILASTLTPSLSRANFFDNIRKFCSSIFTSKSSDKKSTGVAKETSKKANTNDDSSTTNSDKSKGFFENFMKKCLPIVSVLSAITAGVSLFKSFSSPAPVRAERGNSIFTWATKKLFGGALVTAGVCGALLLSWEFFFKKLFDNAVDGATDRGLKKAGKKARRFVRRTSRRVKRDIREVRDESLDKIGEFVDKKRSEVKQDLVDAAEEVFDDAESRFDSKLGDIGEFADDTIKKAKRAVKRVVDKSVEKAKDAAEEVFDEAENRFDAKLTSVEHSIEFTLNDVAKLVDGRIEKANGAVEGQREKFKQDAKEVLTSVMEQAPGVVASGAASSAWSAAKDGAVGAGRGIKKGVYSAYSGVKGFFGSVYNYARSFLRKTSDDNPEEEPAEEERESDLLLVEPPARRKPRPVASKENDYVFETMVSGDQYSGDDAKAESLFLAPHPEEESELTDTDLDVLTGGTDYPQSNEGECTVLGSDLDVTSDGGRSSDSEYEDARE